jgi:hypothetical protein
MLKQTMNNFFKAGFLVMFYARSYIRGGRKNHDQFSYNINENHDQFSYNING